MIQRHRYQAAAIGRLLCALLVGLAGCDGDDAKTSSGDAGTPIRNVILITLDTVRADALGSYGQEHPSSPVLDRMAAKGVRFERVVTSSPSTLPAHATILTGKQPYAHGARANVGYALAAGNVSLAEVLREHGYRTGAEIAAAVIGRQTRLDQGFESFRDTYSPDAERIRADVHAQGRIRQIELPERSARDITDRGLDFLRLHRTEPMFLWLHYFDAHAGPALPPREAREKIPDSRYHAAIRSIDEQIGRVVEALAGLGIRDETLVVVTSDHGEGLGEHSELTHAYYVYDSTIRVPLILWGPPALTQGVSIEPLVRTVDIAPTILDLLGLPPLDSVQGVSLVPLIEGRESDLELTGYGETIEFIAFGTSLLRFVREGEWKYIHKVGPELYEIEKDPGEQENEIDRHPEVAERLLGRLETLIAEGAAKPEGAKAELDAETRAQLIALGYVEKPATSLLDDEQASLELTGIDPREAVADLQQLSRARDAKRREEWVVCAHEFGSLWEKFADPSFGRHLADCEIGVGDYQAVAEVLEAVVALLPGQSELLTRLADAQIRTGRSDEAEIRLREAIAVDPCAASARAVLAQLAFEQRRYAEQIEVLDTGVEACAENTDLLNNLAWALATLPDDSLRDGPRAATLARRTIELDPQPDPGHLDTLAAAHAEAGDFDEAVDVMRRAIKLESKREPPALLGILRDHLAAFEAGRGLRDPAD